MSENGTAVVKVQTAATVAEQHGNSMAPTARTSTGVVEQTRAIAEVQAAMLIARMNPRNEAEAIERIKNSCQRQSLATRARFSYPKGGTEVKGATIHILTACAGHWGNLDYGWREIERHADYSKCIAFAWDIQGNVKTAIEFDVPHIIDTKSGPKKMRDQRDIYELCANMSARRVRSCLERIIPRDVVDEALAECDRTLKANIKDLPAAIDKMLSAFEEVGVSRAQIEKRMGRKVDSLTAAQVIRLGEIFRSISDEMSDPSDWFEEVEITAPTAAEKAKAAHAAPQSATAPVTKEEAPASEKPYNRAEAVAELIQIAETVYGPVSKLKNQAARDWSNNMAESLADLTKAPDNIIELALPNARQTLKSFE